MITHYIRRLRSAVIRHRKQRPITWALRWLDLHAKVWCKFLEMPVSEKSLQWLFRNVERMFKLAERYMEKTAGKRTVGP